MQALLGTIVCKFGGDRVMFVVEEAIFVTSEKCPYHVTLTVTLSAPWMQALLGTIVCKFGSDPATSVVEVAICAKFTDGRTDGQTDGQRTPRDCISSWNELKTETCLSHLIQ